jgi:murein DD-endopeptidase MepM/ murein hydrolase activator NlpD
VASGTDNRVFGKRARKHVLILASGDKVRHMTIRPWMMAGSACLVGALTIGYLGATTYLVLRDDLIGATMARQARMQHDYEDRIAALRAQVDRVTSRQLLDQQVVEQKVQKLLEQQVALSSRHGKLDSLLERADESGVTSDLRNIPVPSPSPAGKDKQAALSGGLTAIDKLLAAETRPVEARADNPTLAYVPLRNSVADRADRVFSKVTLSLKTIEQQQLARIQDLTVGASQKADAIAGILNRAGVDVADVKPSDPQDAVGGPFVEPETTQVFDLSMNDLDSALTRLQSVRDTARKLPFANPAPGHEITSEFGNRVDPFIGRLALHSGIDFRFDPGSPIHTTGDGTVTVAGVVSGYGNMVEVDHGQGITTRYGHMSRILVNVGEKVKSGDTVGSAGSTGRSTGTHLHYEVRRDDKPIDPLHFLNAGIKLTSYLN